MNLADPGTLKAFLARHGLSAKKGLGQHFLCSSKAVSLIASALSECAGLLEIGPGPGVLTSPLSERVSRLIALELDGQMIEALRESAPRADVRMQDALSSNLSEILQELPEPRGVVSNLPYYITGPLLTKIAEAREHYAKAVLMMQREVADRVLAAERTSARGSLSVFLQLQFSIRSVAKVPAGAFLPPPKVDSTVLEFVPCEGHLDNEEFLFRLVRLAFAQPRKTLANNLIAGFQLGREAALKAIEKAELSETARPQELSLEAWKALAHVLAQLVAA